MYGSRPDANEMLNFKLNDEVRFLQEKPGNDASCMSVFLPIGSFTDLAFNPNNELVLANAIAYVERYSNPSTVSDTTLIAIAAACMSPIFLGLCFYGYLRLARYQTAARSPVGLRCDCSAEVVAGRKTIESVQDWDFVGRSGVFFAQDIWHVRQFFWRTKAGRNV